MCHTSVLTAYAIDVAIPVLQWIGRWEFRQDWKRKTLSSQASERVAQAESNFAGSGEAKGFAKVRLLEHAGHLCRVTGVEDVVDVRSLFYPAVAARQVLCSHLRLR